MNSILTAQPGAMALALQEAGGARILTQLEPGVALCADVQIPSQPIFLRHCCPAQAEVVLSGAAEDIPMLVEALRPLLQGLSADDTFSVQTRMIEGYQPGYKRFDVNTALADAVAAQGVALDVKRPAQVVSVTLAQGMGWLGVSRAEDNLSAWAGGMRRFKWEAGQISRAEFKLLEALELFGITVVDGENAIDLGAAPGGWTRVLRQRGMYVTAVDPAVLDARLMRDKRVTHYRGTAQAYFRGKPAMCDLMVNDMKMDTAESAALMMEGAHCLRPGGAAVLTLKLPEDVAQWLPRVQQATAVLEKEYTVAGMRQLFHNRNEVTGYLIRKA